ncbi:MAG TPA: GFA family protein [Polyangiaceae bacterium]|nr:GFA family protein [Polyangiaceae bacterium]
MSQSGSYSGSCLCGAVAYEFEGEPRIVVNCHCSKCRKATGSTVATWVLVPLDRFRWTRGEQLLKSFASSEGAQRSFCGTCGAVMGNLSNKRPTLMHLSAGTLDHAPALQVKFHLHVASKAPWHLITDELPQFADEPSAPPSPTPQA